MERYAGNGSANYRSRIVELLMAIAAISSVVSIFSPLLERLFPDPVERAKKEAEIRLMEASGELEMFRQIFEADKAQMEVNKAEAAHASLFVAGWRPFIGWVCGAAFAWQFVLLPLFNWLVAVSGATVPALPTVNENLLETVLFGMLGLGAMRTVEKVKGVARNSAPVNKLPWQKS